MQENVVQIDCDDVVAGLIFLRLQFFATTAINKDGRKSSAQHIGRHTDIYVCSEVDKQRTLFGQTLLFLINVDFGLETANRGEAKQ